MNKRYVVLLALLACLTGCVPVDSLNPLYTDKDLVFDKALLGTWVGTDNGEGGELTISAIGEKGKEWYELTMTDRDKDNGKCREITVYRAHLVNLSGRRFLDVVPETVEGRSGSFPLQIKSGKDSTVVEPRLLRLSPASYLEFSDRSQSQGKAWADLRRAHWFFKVSLDDKKLQLDWTDDDGFRKAVQSGTLHLPSSLLGEGKETNVVITASTPELQTFIVEHADDGKFFTDHMDPLHRKL
jgi:hypothetical protein